MKLDCFEFGAADMDLGVIAKVIVEIMKINHIRKKLLNEQPQEKHLEVEDRRK